MAINHRLLHRMQLASRIEALDCDEFFAIERRQKLYAGVDRPKGQIVTISIEFGEHYRAGTTVTFGAALFRSGSIDIFAKELQHGSSWIDVADFNDLAVEHKPNLVGLIVECRSLVAHGVQLPLYVE